MRGILPFIAYAYVTLVGLTTSTRTINAKTRDGMRRDGRRFIYAFWHQRQVFFTWTHRGAGAAVLVSRSKDGDIISKTMKLSRIGSVRGSSSRGGVAALYEMISNAQNGVDLGITPDGPKGPAREIKDGVLYLAQKLNAPIVPITNALSHRWQFDRAWDRFQVPLPFGRAVVVYGDPIEVNADSDLEAKARELKNSLDKITAEADALVS